MQLKSFLEIVTDSYLFYKMKGTIFTLTVPFQLTTNLSMKGNYLSYWQSDGSFFRPFRSSFVASMMLMA